MQRTSEAMKQEESTIADKVITRHFAKHVPIQLITACALIAKLTGYRYHGKNTRHCKERLQFYSGKQHKMENSHNFVRMLIEESDTCSIGENSLMLPCFEQYILEQICTNRGKHARLRFGGECVRSDEGALIINAHVDTVSWLQREIKAYRNGSLRIINFKDSPRYTTEVKGFIPRVACDVPIEKVREFLQAQNAGLRTDTWRFLSYSRDRHNGLFGQFVTFLIDDPGREVLERNGFQLFLGFVAITFEVLRRVKRCESTGKIITDDAPALLGED